MSEMQIAEIAKIEFTPAVITCDFKSMNARLDEALADYEGLTPELARQIDKKQAKRERAHLNKMSKELNDSRKAIKKAYNKQLDEFEGGVRLLDDRIKGIVKIIDDAIKEQERAEKQMREDNLQQAYNDLFPALANVVPLDRVIDPKWLNASYGEVKAQNSLSERVSEIANDWESLKLQRESLTYYDEAEREFFRTLSLSTAIKRNSELIEEQQRIDQLKADVEEAQAYQQAEQVNAAVAPEPVATPEPVVDSVGQRAKEVNLHFFELKITATIDQLQMLINFMKEIQITGTYKEVNHE